MTSRAVAAATSPPACPPMPSITPNTPRAASRTGRSSLFSRTRPGCVRAAALSTTAATVRRSATVVQPARARTGRRAPATSAARKTKCSQYSVVIAVASLANSMTSASASWMRAGEAISCSAPGRSTPSAPFTAGGIGVPFDRRAPAAGVLDEEAAGPIAAEPAVLARHLRRREHLHVHPDGAAAAADRQRVLAHAELVMALLVVVGQRGALAKVDLGGR